MILYLHCVRCCKCKKIILQYEYCTYSMVTVNHASYLGGMIWCIAIFSLKGHFLVYKKLFILHRIFPKAPKMILAGKKMFDIRLQSRPRSQTNCLANNCFHQRDCFVFSTTIYCQWRKEDCPQCPVPTVPRHGFVFARTSELFVDKGRWHKHEIFLI